MIKEPEQEKDNEILYSQIKEQKSKKKVIPMATFIASLGMDGTGKEVGRILSIKYTNLAEIKYLRLIQLENIDGIGPIIAKNIYYHLRMNEEEIDKLLQIFILEVPKQGGSLEGKSFVLSGKLESENGEGKKYFKNLIEEKGGIIKGSVSKNIDFLISGDGSGLKTKKAEELGIVILTATKLEEILN